MSGLRLSRQLEVGLLESDPSLSARRAIGTSLAKIEGACRRQICIYKSAAGDTAQGRASVAFP